MKVRPYISHIRVAILILLGLVCASRALAQGANGSIHGQILDPSGASVADATVLVTGADGQSKGATSDKTGTFEIKDLPPGTYTVKVFAKGLTLYQKDGVVLTSGQALRLSVSMTIETQQQQVTVSADAPKVDVNPENNANSLVVSGQDLDALPDDPDELQTDLEALAGPSPGPNGGQMYIDGFTAGQLPPKSAIREIRINQNPFSAEYDKVGYGRIEIFTKPGTDKWHGQFSVNGNDSAFNGTNPFLCTTSGCASQPGYDSVQYSGNLTGPLGKNATLSINVDVRDINQVETVNAEILNSSLLQTPFSDSVLNPRKRYNGGPRLDYQLTKTNTISVRYQYFRNNEMNDGLTSGLALASQAYNTLGTEQTLQATDTQTIGTKIVNETRFQYLRDETNEMAQNSAPTINVLGAFLGGGASLGQYTDNQNHYELQNYTSIVFSKHFVKFGGRLRVTNDNNYTTSSYNGVFTFPSLTAYQITEQGIANGESVAQIQAAGGGASQFTLIQGTPTAAVNLTDVGVYAEDDWKIHRNMVLSYGLRVESQNHIANHVDWAPRLGFSWGLGHGNTPKTVLRAGYGIFYDRFPYQNVLEAERLNGVLQQQYTVADPAFLPPTVPSPSTLSGAQSLPNLYEIGPNLHAPYTMQTAASVERQLTKISNLTLSYLNSRGNDVMVLNNINTPLPGDYNPQDPAAEIRPNPSYGNIFQYQSVGIFRQNQVIVNFTLRAGAKLTLFAYYTLNYANSDAFGATTNPSSPSNPYNILQDYGRSTFDIRDRVFFGGTYSAPYGIRLSPFMLFNSGAPYNITIPQDLVGTSVFNQRPGFVSNTECSTVQVAGTIYCTPLGTFNSVPTAGEALVPVNYGTGPSAFSLNLRVSKTFGFGGETGGGQNRAGGGGGGGPRGGGGPGGGGGGGGRGGGPGGPFGGGGAGGGGGMNRRYNLTLSVNARNIFNDVNLGPPIGTLGSRLFDQSNSLAGGPFNGNGANRQIYLQALFSF
jgi:hypothetical protein